MLVRHKVLHGDPGHGAGLGKLHAPPAHHSLLSEIVPVQADTTCNSYRNKLHLLVVRRTQLIIDISLNLIHFPIPLFNDCYIGNKIRFE